MIVTVKRSSGCVCPPNDRFHAALVDSEGKEYDLRFLNYEVPVTLLKESPNGNEKIACKFIELADAGIQLQLPGVFTALYLLEGKRFSVNESFLQDHVPPSRAS